MGKKQKQWARKARVKLLTHLGNKCAKCSATDNLELDCIEPRGDAHHKLGSDQRISFYKAEHATDNLQILCNKCNIAKSNKHQDEVEPF